jgi:hypothetical protein
MDSSTRPLGPLAALALAVLLAGSLSLAPPTRAQAATITVGPACSLADAILSANADADTGGCSHVGTYGDDIVVLPGGTLGFSAPLSANTALPTITTNVTVVGNGSTIARTNGASAPFFRLLRATGGHLKLLDLTITGGLEKEDGEGGAIQVLNGASLTLASVNLTENGVESISEGFGETARGGALYFESSGALTLTDVALTGNTANSAGFEGGTAEGGAVYVEGDDGEGPALVSLTDVIVLDNSALASGTKGQGGTAEGGGIYIESEVSAIVTRGLLQGNRAVADATAGHGGTARGGALYFEGQSVLAGLTLAELIVSENLARATGSAPGNGGTAEGAGVYVEATVSVISVRDSTFKINIADARALAGKNGGIAEGGGLAIESGGSGTATIVRSAFTQNSAFANGGTCGTCGGTPNGGVGEGGGIRFDGGSGSNLAITSTTVAGNTITCNATLGGGGGVCEGGGINFDGNLLTLTNVTLTGNSTTATGAGACCSDEGGGFFIDSSALIQNSILAANVPNSCGKDEDQDTITSLGNNLFDVLNVAACGAPGPNDKINPVIGLGALADTGQPGGVHRLPQPGSPALDAASAAACPALDQLGNPRAGTCDIGAAERIDAIPQATLLAAVLPASRSGLAGVLLTAFVTIINTSPTTTANQVGIALQSAVPALLGYQTTDAATNALVGTPDTPVDIPPGGSQSFVIFLLSNGAFSSTDLVLAFAGHNTAPVTAIVGLNTFLVSSSVTAIPDVVALAATLGNNGIVDVVGGAGVFSVATVNLGAGGPITVVLNTGAAALGLALFVCQTDPATSVCLGAPAPEVTVDIATDATPTFGVFVNAGGAVPFDPAFNRVFVFFKDAGGVIRGGTSVAVRTL